MVLQKIPSRPLVSQVVLHALLQDVRDRLTSLAVAKH
jgi:hypothetical protein